MNETDKTVKQNVTSRFITKGNAIRFRSNGRRVGYVRTIKAQKSHSVMKALQNTLVESPHNTTDTTNGQVTLVCNTCVQPYDKPFRYPMHNGEIRGCVDRCHDKHVRRNTKPDWCKPRYVLPKWITIARAAIKLLSGSSLNRQLGVTADDMRQPLKFSPHI